MKKSIAALALLMTLPAAADKPRPLWIDSVGTFDANRVFSGSFTVSGAINDNGTELDTPVFNGAAIHITRLMTTSGGEYITLAINGNHVSGTNVPPNWCPQPPVSPGTLLFAETGNWTILSATGQYAMLQGTGAWGSWVTVDPSFGPLSAKDCLIGQMHYIR
jgi:hypothetical protein